MDNVTHTLYGLALAKTGLQRISPRATLAIIMGANLPDVDILSLFWGQINYLKYHRELTHGLLGTILGALLLASVVYIGNRQAIRKRGVRLWTRIFFASIIGTGSHFLLDYTNSYGLRPFAPFNQDWYSWDIVFIVDPWILAVLSFGLGLPFLLRLVTQEIGARPVQYARGAFFSLVIILGYWVLKDFSHRHAIVDLNKHIYSSQPPVRVGAMPKIFNPLAWSGIAETETSYHLTDVGLSLFHNPFETRRNRLYHKVEHLQPEIIEAAKAASQARIFLEFARFPLFAIDPSDQGYTVTVRDLRFESATARRRRFQCTIKLDKNLNVVSESFHF